MLCKSSLNYLNTAVIVLDMQCQIVLLNESAEQLLSLTERQFKGTDLFQLVEADFDGKTLLLLSQQQKNTFIEAVHFKTHSGEMICNVLISCFEQQQNDYLLLELQSSEHHSHIIKDLELQQQSRVSNHLIRNLAHEIKNPLGGIKGAAQLLSRKLPADIPDKYCQIIIQESDRLSELVGRLLLPAQPEIKTSVNIHQLIEQSLEIVLLQSNQSIKVVKDYDPSLPELWVAPEQIQQALINLIKNAVEALEQDPTITLKSRILLQHTIGQLQHKQVIRIDIIDNGSGIPEGLIKDIFFPTISGKNSSGLGLSIAQSLAQRHGGIIEVESGRAHTCFSLYLPVAFDSLSN